ncbi:MAG: CoA transferase [Candidatus Rokuibacteriota bacterium]
MDRPQNAPPASYDAPYAGLRVVDLSQGIAGPYAAMLLAAHGADVVKVEPPGGDWARRLGRRYGDQTAFSIAGNLGKRSIVLDLKTREDLAVLRRLAARADVFVEGFRPGVAVRLGVGYEEISASNPRVVYLSVSGFGQWGVERDRPAMDPVLQAFTGLMWANRGADGVPQRVRNIVVDMSTALYAFQALSAALYARRDLPWGCHIDTSLMRSAAALQCVHVMASYLEGGTMRPGFTPSGNFATADGWMCLVIQSDAEFQTLCDVLELPDVRQDPRFTTDESRFAHVAALTERLDAGFARRGNVEWSARLREARLMHQPVQDYLEFLKHPHVEATGAVAWLQQPGVGQVPVPRAPGLAPFVDGSPRATAPSLDQHRAEILAQLANSQGDPDS